MGTQVWVVAEALGVSREAEALAQEALAQGYTEAEALEATEVWVLENGGAELLEKATEGAARCISHWEAEAEAEFVAEAEARRDRLAQGCYTEADLLGARDWAEAEEE